jgi:hypothetical protein
MMEGRQERMEMGVHRWTGKLVEVMHIVSGTFLLVYTNLNVYHFKYVQSIVCQEYLNKDLEDVQTDSNTKPNWMTQIQDELRAGGSEWIESGMLSPG